MNKQTTKLKESVLMTCEGYIKHIYSQLQIALTCEPHSITLGSILLLLISFSLM